jgi:hypothetical protein
MQGNDQYIFSKSPNNALWGKRPTKIPLSSSYIGLKLKCGYLPSEPPLKKTNLSLASGCHLQSASWLGMRAHVSFYLLPPRHHLAWPCMCCHSFYEFICAPVLLCLKHVASLVSSSLSGLRIFLPPLLHSSLSPVGRGFDEDITLCTECSKVSHSLHIVQHDEAELDINLWM